MVPIIHGNEENNTIELTTFYDATISVASGNAEAPPKSNKKININKPRKLTFKNLQMPKCDPQKVTPWNLESDYNTNYLRLIIHKTEQDGTPPEESIEFFRLFLERYKSNYISLPGFVETKVGKIIKDPEKASSMKSLLFDYVTLAILFDQQEDCTKSLNRNRLSMALLLSKIQAEKKTKQIDESAA